MKKTLIITLLGASTGFGACAQSQAYLDINNVKALVNSDGILFTDKVNITAGFEVPAGSGSHTVFASSMWIGGIDLNGQLSVSAETHGALDGFSYGPINGQTANWDQVWKINRSTVDSFHAWYDAGVFDANNGTNTQAQNYPGYTIPQIILNWPAHGDISVGQNFYLAPFYDRDQDGIYNPISAGDRPIMRGDQTVMFIANDQLNPMQTSLGVEVIGMIYGYGCGSDEALFNTVFTHYEMRNLSTNSYYDSYIGQWTDLDIGNAADDFIQCDVGRGAYFGFNGDAFDETNSGSPGYGTAPPAQSVVFLAGPLQDNDGMDNPVGINANESINGFGYGDGIADNERLGMSHFMSSGHAGTGNPNQGAPITAVDFYNYMRSIWQDGTALTYGGSGHFSDPASNPNQLAKYFYPGDSDPLGFGTFGVPQATWDEFTAGAQPQDRRAVGSSGPFTFEAGEYIDVDLAFVYGRDPNGTTVNEGVVAMLQNVDDIKSYFSSNSGPCSFDVSVHVITDPLEQLEVFPNPTSSNVQLHNVPENAVWQVYDLMGKKLREGTALEATQVDFYDLPSGMYLLLVSSNEFQKTYRIIRE